MLQLYGIKKNANIANLSESDFLILDPWKARKINMSGRQLLRGDHDSNHWKKAKAKGFVICIYTDPSTYTKQSIALKEPGGF